MNGHVETEVNQLKEEAAYFTVEAALVMPCVLAVIVTVIYLLFYQYDRCLMEQNLGLLMLEAYAAQTDDDEALMTVLQSGAEDGDERYLALDAGELSVSIRGRRIRLSMDGSLRYPFAGLPTGASEGTWEISAQMTGNKLSPVSFIRNYRKILGGT